MYQEDSLKLKIFFACNMDKMGISISLPVVSRNGNFVSEFWFILTVEIQFYHLGIKC